MHLRVEHDDKDPKSKKHQCLPYGCSLDEESMQHEWNHVQNWVPDSRRVVTSINVWRLNNVGRLRVGKYFTLALCPDPREDTKAMRVVYCLSLHH